MTRSQARTSLGKAIARRQAAVAPVEVPEWQLVEYPSLDGITLFPKQQMVWDAIFVDARRRWESATHLGDERALVEVGFGGSPGPGKSFLFGPLIWELLLRFPGYKMCIGRKHEVTITTSVWPYIVERGNHLRQRFGIQWDYAKTDGVLTVHNAEAPELCSQLFRVELKDPGKIQGSNLDGIAIDEATQTTYEALGQLKQRHRGGIVRTMGNKFNWPRVFLWAGNPAPGWCKDLYWRPYSEGRLGHGDLAHRVFVPFKTADNPMLPADYARNIIESHGERYGRMLLEGDWGAMPGRVFEFDFTEFVEDFDVVALAGGPPERVVDIGAYDWGVSHKAAMMAGFIAAGPDGVRRLYVVDAFAVSGMDVWGHANWMLQYPRATWYADRSIWDPRPNDMASPRIAEELVGCGVMAVPANEGGQKGSVEKGIIIARRLLSRRLVVFSPRCAGFLDGLSDYSYDVGPSGEPVPGKCREEGEDEGDCFRYLCINVAHELLDDNELGEEDVGAGGRVEQAVQEAAVARVAPEARGASGRRRSARPRGKDLWSLSRRGVR